MTVKQIEYEQLAEERDRLARRVAELEAALRDRETGYSQAIEREDALRDALREIADLTTQDVTFAAGVEGSMRKLARAALAGDGGGA